MPGPSTLLPNEAFLYALEEHMSTLTPAEQGIFINSSPESLLDEVRRLDAQHATRSKARKYTDRFVKIVESLRPYFATIDTLVSSHPDVAALVWGGLRFVIRVIGSFLSL